MVNFIFHKISFLLVIGRQDKPLKPISSLSPTFPVLITQFFHEVTYIGRYLQSRAFRVSPYGTGLLRHFLFLHFPLNAEINNLFTPRDPGSIVVTGH
jgi:hypothetical protein